MELTAATPPPATGDQPNILSRSGDNWLQKSAGWLVLLLFLVTSLAFTWPLATNLGGALFDRSDATDTTWRMGSIARQLLNDPLHLYASNTFYPLKQNLQLDELVVGDGLLFAPVVWLSGNPVLAYNLLILSNFALSGFAMWLLVRHLTGSSGAGLVAGMIYAFSPWHQAQFAHGGLGAQAWMVFALYFLILFTQQPKALSRRALLYLGLFVFFFDLQILCAGYYAYFIAILCGFYLLYYFLTRFTIYDLRFTISRIFGSGKQSRAQPPPTEESFGEVKSRAQPPPTKPKTDLVEQSRAQPPPTDEPRDPKLKIQNSPTGQPYGPKFKILRFQFGLLAAAGVVALLILLPFIRPYVAAQQEYGFKRDLAETRYWSAAPPSLLRTVQRSWLYKPVQRGVLGAQSSGERVMYPGLITLGLALLGLFAGRKTARGLRWTFGLLALTALLLSFGPYFNLDEFGDRFRPQQLNIQLPYLWLYNLVPGFDSLRVPHRFAQLLMLALAVCAGFGVARLVPSSRFQVPPTGQPYGPSFKLGRSSKFKVQSSKFKEGFQKPETKNSKLKIQNSKFKIQNSKLKTWLWTILMIGLVGVEFFAPGLPQVATPMGEQAPAMYRWLADEVSRAEVSQDALLLELPVVGPPVPINSNPEYALYNLTYNRPMLNGTANILPPGYERLFNEIRDFPDLRSLDVAEGLGVKFLLVHGAAPPFDEAKRTALAKFVGPSGRLEVVKEFGTDVIYRLKRSGRFDGAAQLIPPGAEVLVGDDNNHKSLYPAGIINLIGSDRRYFSTYRTIYHPQMQSAQPGKIYDYAIFYQGTNPTTYGYTASNLIWQNEIIQIYRK